MCGIVGRAGFLEERDEKVMKVMLLLDYLRGQDSTGIAVISKKGTVDVLKVADDPIMLFQHADWDSTMVGQTDAIWIGHNRAATVGATNRANAHPFTCGHITGVHNGTLEKSSLLDIAERLPETYGTDSETIFAHIAKYGVEDTIPRLQGAWALVWYDAYTETLNMIRNEKRPLYTCEIERDTGRILTWASEYQMIAAARHMSNKPDGDLVLYEKDYAYFPLPIDLLHTWTKDQLLRGDLKAATKVLVGKPAPVTTFTPTVYHTNTNTNTAPALTTVVDLYEEFTYSGDVSESSDKIFGELSEQEWHEVSEYGCSCCGRDVSPEDEGLIVCVNEGVVICPNCSEQEHTTIVNAYTLTMSDKLLGSLS